MGEEAPESLVDGVEHFSDIGGYHTATIINKKTYIVGSSGNGVESTICVRIFDKSTGKWSTPPVLGMKPAFCKLHSAIILNEDRILIVKSDSATDDCFWFLEVDTLFVREQAKVRGCEVVAWSKGVLGGGPKPVVISGPSGVGKGTLISKLMEDFPSMFGFSVSHTTRTPREREKDGVHYHFTERSEMKKDIREGKFLESASVHGNLYGTSIEAVEVVTDSGKRCILDIDVQGARSVRASSLEAVFIFICPPSFEELEKRLRSRGTETEEQVEKRLRNAKAELDQGKAPGLFDHILVNDDLEKCYDELKKALELEKSNGFSTHDSSVKFGVSGFPFVQWKDRKKILIDCGDVVSVAGLTTLELDTSSIKGGSPGRTRGLSLRCAVANGLH